VAIRLGGIQPIYLPWLGYFDQMQRVDVFVIADEMPFTTSSFYHRNRVKGPHGPAWLTLPARAKRGDVIADARLDCSVPWAQKHLDTLRHFYARGCDCAATLAELAPILRQNAERLVDITIPAVQYLAASLGVRTPVLVSSELSLEARYRERFPAQPGPTHRIIAYMEALGATELLEGESGRQYLDTALLAEHGIRVRFHQYEHPTYPQLHGAFASHMSALDLLLCVGSERATAVLANGRLRDEC